MSGNKNKKFVFWLIGFGCGMILSGVIILVLVLNTNVYQQETIKHLSNDEQKKIIEQLNIIQSKLSQSATQNDQNTSEKQLDETIQMSEKILEVEDITKELAQEEKTPIYVAVYIPVNATANKICDILQQAGVISDAKSFSDYIKIHKKTKHLRSGKIELPIDETYEVLLDILTIK